MANIRISIDYYDQEHRDLIQQHFPSDFEVINPLAGTTIEVPFEDFKTYCFFRHQYDKDGYRKFLDLNRLAANWGEYELYFEYNGETRKLVSIYPGNIDEAQISEMLGVAGGLSVASSIYGFTQADWTRIPTQAHKDFDFSHLSAIDERAIRLETKGSINENNAIKTSSVSNHKSNITSKKSDDSFRSKYDYQRDTCIGIITVADRDNFLKCWLLDPPGENIEENPRKLRLLKRLYYYHAILRLISKRSYPSLILPNRIRSIELTNDYQSLDGLPLLNSNFDKIYVSESFIESRDHNDDGTIVGKSFLFDNGLYFVGIEATYYEIIVNQRFDEILGIKSLPKTSQDRLWGKIRKDERAVSKLKQLDIEIQEAYDGRYLYFQTNVEFTTNSSGLTISRLSKR